MNKNNLYFNSKYIWHPYDSIVKPLPCYFVSSAKGVHITLQSGVQIIDGMSSWWSAIHGYNHKKLNQALKKQIDHMSHVMFGGFTHKPAISLCKRLLNILPKKLKRIFFCDSGSVSIEIAMKMALQYWKALKIKKNKFLTIRNGYHGDTLFAMSVCDPVNSMHNLYHNVIPKNLFSKQPQISFQEKWNICDIKSFNDNMMKFHHIIAAVILEPIVQGIGNMQFYHSEYLKNIRLICNIYNIPLIIDEIATGFGRTGKLFAFQYSNITPDILCIGKALTGGMLTLSAVITTQKISDIISNNYPYKFMHGPTFMGNPLACAVASKNISILQKGLWKQQVRCIEKYFINNLFLMKNHPRIKEIRVLGAIAVIECYHFVNLKLIQKFFVNHGVWIRPFKNIIYLTPPYIIKKYYLKKMIIAIKYAIQNNRFFIL
ncbi:adenosylmethionine--8-amino-7-oxononanoate transaminase [Buchnera aphidicola]|uniref:adenosylmethionine--8-amino-7-oxononanoate transaminase n=1 Tax=Buchnera aphidicola TaxID=9 RepID=UPI003463BF68